MLFALNSNVIYWELITFITFESLVGKTVQRKSLSGNHSHSLHLCRSLSPFYLQNSCETASQTRNCTHHQLCIQQVVELQLLIHFQAVCIHLLLFLLSKIIILLLYSVAFLHFVPSQSLPYLENISATYLGITPLEIHTYVTSKQTIQPAEFKMTVFTTNWELLCFHVNAKILDGSPEHLVASETSSFEQYLLQVCNGLFEFLGVIVALLMDGIVLLLIQPAYYLGNFWILVHVKSQIIQRGDGVGLPEDTGQEKSITVGIGFLFTGKR